MVKRTFRIQSNYKETWLPARLLIIDKYIKTPKKTQPGVSKTNAAIIITLIFIYIFSIFLKFLFHSELYIHSKSHSSNNILICPSLPLPLCPPFYLSFSIQVFHIIFLLNDLCKINHVPFSEITLTRFTRIPTFTFLCVNEKNNIIVAISCTMS